MDFITLRGRIGYEWAYAVTSSTRKSNNA